MADPAEILSLALASGTSATAISTTQPAVSYSTFVATTYNLTTVFTPPAWCFAPTYTVAPDGNDSFTAGDVAIRGYRPECFPIGFFDVFTFTTNDAEQGSPSFLLGSTRRYTRGVEIPASYYSPGVCPSGYVSAAGTYDGENYYDTCCPSSMSVIESSCTSRASTVTLVNGTDTWTQTVEIARAPSIVVAYQSSDLSLWTTPGSTSTPTAATTSRPTDAVDSPTTTEEEQRRGLFFLCGQSRALRRRYPSGITWGGHRVREEQLREAR
ncbi:unnamed protein product [Cercospora beticola]|nr:unnamed protein product [Cercospora beticola]